ncbi:BgTH12-02853 [Blumeria graminis f. sp. triticale]|uniref:BgtAc-30940 n=3 Tax=Blumeria graminis TaxID=34373 RepID=A0A9X9QDF0_BLUGR|nr:hypothetical protein BGT96224_Ac30940 [Blumeria graminis f. sp. tritici 96224]CAD6503185.1 BgTH12-02853 [Blumeria graminis f. sp. triticale]VDB89166.1 BgtAc-30940 [Blumeria graminis f. sp. tritici]
MAPPARAKKRGVPVNLDPKRRVQKHTNNTVRSQPLAEALNRSLEKGKRAVEKSSAVQNTQVVASSSEQPLGLTTVIEGESDQEPVIEEFPPFLSSNSLKRSFDLQVSMEDPREINDSEKEDTQEQSSKIMTKARSLLNLVGPYLEEVDLECPGTGAGFLALIPDEVTRAIRGEKINTDCEALSQTISTTPLSDKNTWAARIAIGKYFFKKLYLGTHRKTLNSPPEVKVMKIYEL